MRPFFGSTGWFLIGLLALTLQGCGPYIVGYANKPRPDELPKRYSQCKVAEAFRLDNGKDAVILDCPWGQEHYTHPRLDR